MLSAFWPEGVFRYANIPLQTVTDACVRRPASMWREKEALVTPEASITYGQLLLSVDEGASALRGQLAPGAKVSWRLLSPRDEVVWLLAIIEAGLIACPHPEASVDAAVSAERWPGVTTFTPQELLGGPKAEPPSQRPDLRSPRLVMGGPSGEVSYSHRALVAMALSWAAFFQLGEDVEVALVEPPTHWLGLAALLASLMRGSRTYLLWGRPSLATPVDYLVASWEILDGEEMDSWRGMVRIGVLAGLEGPFSPWRRRWLSWRLRAPILTILGRNDLGPVLASHPEWHLPDAVGIPLCNVDTRPLDPAHGQPLAVGWDVIEAAELGVKSPMVPQGAQLTEESWARSHLLASIDPSGLFYLLKRA